jgi:ribosome maturation factor RimP
LGGIAFAVSQSPKGIKQGDKKFRGKLEAATKEDYTIIVNNYPLKLTYKQTKKVNLDPDLKSVRV